MNDDVLQAMDKYIEEINKLHKIVLSINNTLSSSSLNYGVETFLKLSNLSSTELEIKKNWFNSELETIISLYSQLKSGNYEQINESKKLIKKVYKTIKRNKNLKDIIDQQLIEDLGLLIKK
ncbi:MULTISPECIES: hypothetical protein [Lactobacillus]|uniref:hypothetical protein n=1 Tax=Lactobacillus TaxID=1578 RepID=UPI000BEEF035|nr:MULTISPECIES: hypothetical protein [Lactobacillus]PEG89854.1 hypothetical protein CP363_10380 [Lactobacillus sp. UMNPBX12]PEG91806.1 hypothetical protein CP362_10230 [Lactobacillus sp. UMNPBX11]